MHTDPVPIAGTRPTTRSRISNGLGRLLRVDGRSSSARRFRDLVADLSRDLGGALSEAEQALVRQAAAMTLQSEAMQAAIVRGEAVDPEQLVRVSNALARLTTGLSRKHHNKPPPGPSLAEYLRQKAETQLLRSRRARRGRAKGATVVTSATVVPAAPEPPGEPEQ